MQPNYLPQGPAFELDWSDRKAVQKLYGKAVWERPCSEQTEDPKPLPARLAPRGHQIVQSDGSEGSCLQALGCRP